MRGGSAIQAVLEANPESKVRVFVVWQSILPSDWSRPGPGILARVKDVRARQYWDPGNIFPQQLQRRLKADATHPQPTCCETDEGIPWDLVAIYPAGAKWDSVLPTAIFIDGPVWQKKSELNKALAGR